MTKEELSQLYYLNREIEWEQKRLRELETVAAGSSIKVTGLPQIAGGTGAAARYEAEIAALKVLIEENVKRCFLEVSRLNRYIQGIEDSRMRMILSLRYINGLTWQQVAFHIGESDESYVRKKHNRFLKLSENAEMDALSYQ